MSFRTRLRVDCDLGTLPVNVRTSRAPSLSMIRQCRKATSKGSSFLSEKSTLNIGLGWVCVILPPHCVRSPWSVYHSRWRSMRFGDAVFGQADTAQPLYLSCVASARCVPIRERVLTNRPLGFVIGLILALVFVRSLCVEGHSVFAAAWAPLSCFWKNRINTAAIAGRLPARMGAPACLLLSSLRVLEDDSFASVDRLWEHQRPPFTSRPHAAKVRTNHSRCPPRPFYEKLLYCHLICMKHQHGRTRSPFPP